MRGQDPGILRICPSVFSLVLHPREGRGRFPGSWCPSGHQHGYFHRHEV